VVVLSERTGKVVVVTEKGIELTCYGGVMSRVLLTWIRAVIALSRL
jgi:hypothetical protein